MKNYQFVSIVFLLTEIAQVNPIILGLIWGLGIRLLHEDWKNWRAKNE